MILPILERLRRKPQIEARPTIAELEALLAAPRAEAVTINPDGTVGAGYVNPDGPEAADTIEQLYHALRAARPYVYGVYSGENGTEDDLAVLDQLHDALDQARGERRYARDSDGTRSAETRSKAPSVGCQSGPKGNAQTPPSSVLLRR